MTSEKQALEAELKALQSQRDTLQGEVDAIYAKADHDAFMKKIDLSGADKKIKKLKGLIEVTK